MGRWAQARRAGGGISGVTFPEVSGLYTEDVGGYVRVNWSATFDPDQWFIEWNGWSGSEWVFISIYSEEGTARYHQTNLSTDGTSRFRITSRIGGNFSGPGDWVEWQAP